MCMYVCMTVNSFQSSECCIIRLGMGTQLVMRMIVGYYYFLKKLVKIWAMFFCELKLADTKLSANSC